VSKFALEWESGQRYVLHFEKGRTPPTNATWSVSMYDPQGFFVPNAMNRYNLAAWMPLEYNSDGSLDLYIQTSSLARTRKPTGCPRPPAGRSASRFVTIGSKNRFSMVVTSFRQQRV
jgi:hypothetical protein